MHQPTLFQNSQVLLLAITSAIQRIRIQMVCRAEFVDVSGWLNYGSHTFGGSQSYFGNQGPKPRTGLRQRGRDDVERERRLGRHAWDGEGWRGCGVNSLTDSEDERGRRRGRGVEEETYGTAARTARNQPNLAQQIYECSWRCRIRKRHGGAAGYTLTSGAIRRSFPAQAEEKAKKRGGNKVEHLPTRRLDKTRRDGEREGQ